MPSGIIVIDKPTDWTSHDVVAKLRGRFKERRIGHAGTLDPMATGILPVFVGRATRAVEFASEGEKEYIAGLRLGLETDTQDITGTILSSNPVHVSKEKVLEVLPSYCGDLLQIPPMYSAIKLQGKKLYELARAGKEVERTPRPITIFSLSLLEQVSETDFLLRVACSKGTYIRTLCHDIGVSLGCGACLYSLRRTMAAGFTEGESVTLDQVLNAESPERLLMPVDSYFKQYPSLCVDKAAECKIRNGASFPYEGFDGFYRVYNENQDFLMLGKIEQNQLITVKSFFEV